MPSHAQVLTVTPLEGGAEPVLMTQEQIGAYAASKPKEKKAVERSVPERQQIVTKREEQKRLKRTDRSSNLGALFSPRQRSGSGDMPTPAQTLTVTPMDNNASVVPMSLPDIGLHNPLLMRPDEISALAPPRPKQPELPAFGPMTSSDSGGIEYKFEVQGVDTNSPCIKAILECLEYGSFEGDIKVFYDFKAKSTSGGSVEISFKAEDLMRDVKTIADELHTAVGNLFCNLHDLGVSERDFKFFPRKDFIFEHLSNADWHCEQTEDAVRGRAQLVRYFLLTGHFGLAFPLICDLADVCNMTGMHHLLESRSREILPPDALVLIQNSYPITSKEFTDLAFKTLGQNPQFLKHRYCLVQAGRILLRSISDPLFQSDFHHATRQKLFAAIGDYFRKGCKTKEEAEALLQDLLDLPEDDRGELLLDPRARRLLLIAFPSFRVFEEIEGNAQEVFWDRKKALENQGIDFSGDELADKPVEINGLRIKPFVNLLLDLAEAAVMCAGRINWAIGVLQCLSKRVLEEDQIERVLALRDRIQLTVKSDPQVESTFETVKTLTDEATANLRKMND